MSMPMQFLPSHRAPNNRPVQVLSTDGDVCFEIDSTPIDSALNRLLYIVGKSQFSLA